MYIINMNTLHFEWDENKNASNIEKHGVSFEEAASVFYDTNALLEYDVDHSESEKSFLYSWMQHQRKCSACCSLYS